MQSHQTHNSTNLKSRPITASEEKQKPSVHSEIKKEPHLYDKFLEIEAIKKLLLVDPNENRNGYNGLHAAAEFTVDTEQRISLFIKHGTDVNSQDKNTRFSNTPLHVLIINERSKEAIFYIEQTNQSEQKLNFNMQDSQGKTTLLMAVKTCQVEVALAIIKQRKEGRNVSLDLADHEGYTPLHYACAFGLPEVAKALIENGAKINAMSKTSKKPIDLTVLDNNAIISLLQSVEINGHRDEMARYNIVNDVNLQPLMPFSEIGSKKYLGIPSVKESKEFVSKILEEGVLDTTALAFNKVEMLRDTSQKKKILAQFDMFTGRTLVEKCMASQGEVVEYLIEKGADFGWLIRSAAAKGDHTKLNRLLEKPTSGEFIKQPGIPSGKTALHQAASHGHKEICQLLLEKKAEINCTDKDGNTPLHLAILGSHLETVHLLAKQGANLLIKNKDGKAVLDLVSLPKYSKSKLIIDSVQKSQNLQQSIVSVVGF